MRKTKREEISELKARVATLEALVAALQAGRTAPPIPIPVPWQPNKMAPPYRETRCGVGMNVATDTGSTSLTPSWESER